MQCADPTGARTHLCSGFLAGDEQTRPFGTRRVRGCIEQQRRLADTWFAREQCHRPWHETAAEHTIEFGHAGGSMVRGCGIDFTDRQSRRADGTGCDCMQRRATGFRDGAPRLAFGATADPARND